MIKIKLDDVMHEKRINALQLSKMTGIRYPSLLDMQNNTIKRIPIENLDKIMKALELKSVDELIEYIPNEVQE